MPQLSESTDRATDWSNSRPLLRRGLMAALLLAITAPLVVWGSQKGIRSMFNAPLLWVDRDAPARKDFNQFLELFGAHEMIVVTWPGCTINDPKLVAAADALRAVRQQRADDGKAELFNQVLSGKSVLEALMEPPIDLSRKAALKRLEGVLVGHDGETSCLVVELTDAGGIGRRETIPLIKDTVAEVVEIPSDQLILSGPATDGLAIDNESIRSIEAYSIPSTIISLMLCWFCLRSVWLTIPILLVGIWGQGFMLASVYFSSSTMNAILIVLPALIFMLTVSAGVHLANYFLEEVKDGPNPDAPRRALEKAKGPCILAALTTVIGLVSLAVSEVQPIRQFGLLGAFGLVVCVFFLFWLIPGVLAFRLRRNPEAFAPSATSSLYTSLWSFNHLSHWIYKFGLPVRIACIGLMIGCGWGLFHLRTTVDVVSLLDEEDRAVRDFQWIQEKISPLVPIEVVVHFDQNSDLDLLQRLIVLQAVQKRFSEVDGVDGEMSALTFLPELPLRTGIGGQVRRSVFLKQVADSRQSFIDGNYLADTADGEAWRISARIPGKEDFNYGNFLGDLQSQLAPVVAKVESRGVTVTSTGVLTLVYQIQEALLDDLFKSFLTALVLVAITMMITLRSFMSGLLAMLPNIFPTMVLFGALGWGNSPIDIGSVMTASVALGIAVDGTFHFLKWFVYSVQQGNSQETAIRTAYQHCGPALVQTTVICACGLLVYSFSGFLPVRNFAWVLLMMLVTALVGDMILLPALLSGWLGKILTKVNRHHIEANNRVTLATSSPPAPHQGYSSTLSHEQSSQ